MEDPTIITKLTDYAYVYQRSEFVKGRRWGQGGACSALVDNTEVWLVFAEPVVSRILEITQDGIKCGCTIPVHIGASGTGLQSQ